jgi:hypothetical protein
VRKKEMGWEKEIKEKNEVIKERFLVKRVTQFNR